MLAGKFLLATTGGTAAAASFTTVQSEVMPIVVAALLIDSCIVAIWYFLGVILNNDRVKGSARSEAYQLVGTAILAMIIIGVMLMFGSLFFNVLGASTLMSPPAISSMCQNVMITTQLDLIGMPNTQQITSNTDSPSLLSGPSTPTTQFAGICGIVQSASASPSLTEQIDYPLAAAATILANITNQTAANLQYAFSFDAFIGFLSVLKPFGGICVTLTGFSSQCFIPVPEEVKPVFQLGYIFQPYGGYDVLLTNLGTLGALLTTALEMCSAQLNFIVMSLYIWPYLLFIGLVLRATLFTRPLGGLFIAAALAIVLIFPISYAIEYLALAQPITTATGATYGFNPQTSLEASVPPSTGNYVINFFVQPNLKGIINNVDASYGDNCWRDNLEADEFGDLATLLVPGVSIVSLIVQLSKAGLPGIVLPYNCKPATAMAIFYQFINAYGIIGISVYVLPLLNIMVALTAMLGLSGLMGGDTSLAGLARLIPGG
jgi:hypothetical protein